MFDFMAGALKAPSIKLKADVSMHFGVKNHEGSNEPDKICNIGAKYCGNTIYLRTRHHLEAQSAKMSDPETSGRKHLYVS